MLNYYYLGSCVHFSDQLLLFLLHLTPCWLLLFPGYRINSGTIHNATGQHEDHIWCITGMFLLSNSQLRYQTHTPHTNHHSSHTIYKNWYLLNTNATGGTL